MKGLSGKSIIVTGGASGIGLAAAIELGRLGCLVTIADLDSALGKEAVAKVNKNDAGGKAQFVRTNVNDEASVIAMVGATEASFGRLDGAINSAGVAQRGVLLHELSEADWDRTVGINLRGMFFCMKHQVISMQKSGGGSIVAIASIAAIQGVGNSAEYCASKAGVLGLMRAASIDYARNGIRVNAILPGASWTPMTQAAIGNDPNLQNIINGIPMARMGEPEEIANGAIWLLSDYAAYTNGVSLPVDGALSII